MGYDVILTIMNMLMKYVHFLLLKHPYLARGLAALFVHEIVSLHRVSLIVVSHKVTSFWFLFGLDVLFFTVVIYTWARPMTLKTMGKLVFLHLFPKN